MAKSYYIRVEEEDLSLFPITHLKPFLPVTFSTPNPPSLFLILSISRNARTTCLKSQHIYILSDQIPSHSSLKLLLYLCQIFPPSYIQQDESNLSSNRNQKCRAAHTDLSSRPKVAQTDAMFARKSAISSSIDALDAHSAYANSAKTSVDSKSRQDDSHKWVSVPDPRSTDRSLSGKEGGGGQGLSS